MVKEYELQLLERDEEDKRWYEMMLERTEGKLSVIEEELDENLKYILRMVEMLGEEGRLILKEMDPEMYKKAFADEGRSFD